MIRNEGALSHRWSIIKAACSKFHGYFDKVKNRKESGKTMKDGVPFVLCPFDYMSYLIFLISLSLFI
jgi:hypothetical protein